MSRYSNNSQNDEILSRLQEAKTASIVQQLIVEYFPGWLVSSSQKYSPDYKFLQDNWNLICTRLSVNPQKIILVDDIKFDDNHSNLTILCEFLTKNGYCIRRKDEFVICNKCKLVIPCLALWLNLKNRSINVPKQWSDKCSNC
jgi:hypothetical protein